MGAPWDTFTLHLRDELLLHDFFLGLVVEEHP